MLQSNAEKFPIVTFPTTEELSADDFGGAAAAAGSDAGTVEVEPRRTSVRARGGGEERAWLLLIEDSHLSTTEGLGRRLLESEMGSRTSPMSSGTRRGGSSPTCKLKP